MKKRVISLFLTACMMLSLIAAIPFVGSAATTSTSGWDGTTSTQPSGSGTEDDPYLVANAENLRWIRTQIQEGNNKDDCPVSLKGVYFLQTQDIDLNGKDLRPIGWYYENTNKMAAFGGVYDGQGYSIRNGNLISYWSGHNMDAYKTYGDGLFGVIYGATIKNIVLDNVAIKGTGIVGGIVGRAVATADDKGYAENFNVVENCTINASCSLTASFPTGANQSKGNHNQRSIAGGIVGMAYGTTVRYCVNNATINVPGNYCSVGGIVGTAGYNTLVNYCVNNGMINYNIDSYAQRNNAEVAVGGIVGRVSPYNSDETDGGYDASLVGDMRITNCYNSGGFAFAACGDVGTNALYWGGILGGAYHLTYGTTNLIENCYNLHGLRNGANGIASEWKNYRFGGLLGSYWIGENENVAVLTVATSYSVDIDEVMYGGSNQCRYKADLKTKDGELCVNETTSGQKTAEELASYTKAIDDAISAFNATATAKKVGKVAYQVMTDGSNAVRFSAQIVGTNYECVGFKVTASYTDGGELKTSEAKDVALYTYYTSLKAGDNTETPDAGNAFIAFVIDHVPTDKGDVTFTLTPYVVSESGASFGNTVSVTISASAFAAE